MRYPAEHARLLLGSDFYSIRMRASGKDGVALTLTSERDDSLLARAVQIEGGKPRRVHSDQDREYVQVVGGDEPNC